MQRLITSHLRIIALKIAEREDIDLIQKEMKEKYNTSVEEGTDPEKVRALYEALKKLPPDLVKACRIDSMGFEDLGPSKKYYPNHGRYKAGTLVINERILSEPVVERDKEGNAITKFEQTYYHELGHGYDEKQKGEKDWLSLKDDWLKLSNWSEKPKAGYKKLIIREEGSPELKGEWYYGPGAKFTRFYAKRNPWDDWADSFSFYVGGLKGYLPANKREYFDKLLGKYYGR